MQTWKKQGEKGAPRSKGDEVKLKSEGKGCGMSLRLRKGLERRGGRLRKTDYVMGYKNRQSDSRTISKGASRGQTFTILMGMKGGFVRKTTTGETKHTLGCLYGKTDYCQIVWWYGRRAKKRAASTCGYTGWQEQSAKQKTMRKGHFALRALWVGKGRMRGCSLLREKGASKIIGLRNRG